ncbi:MAG TPA: hypothetical protein PKD24_14815 [Pyrinomonadaceae bacterium]|nr:hypothetical protein [Pyrinomonadaceae bacterium]HMP66681.1 hypothetical protein [Pyrinomonadaceae bacterium]
MERMQRLFVAVQIILFLLGSGLITYSQAENERISAGFIFPWVEYSDGVILAQAIAEDCSILHGSIRQVVNETDVDVEIIDEVFLGSANGENILRLSFKPRAARSSARGAAVDRGIDSWQSRMDNTVGSELFLVLCGSSTPNRQPRYGTSSIDQFQTIREIVSNFIKLKSNPELAIELTDEIRKEKGDFYKGAMVTLLTRLSLVSEYRYYVYCDLMINGVLPRRHRSASFLALISFVSRDKGDFNYQELRKEAFRSLVEFAASDENGAEDAIVILSEAIANNQNELRMYLSQSTAERIMYKLKNMPVMRIEARTREKFFEILHASKN